MRLAFGLTLAVALTACGVPEEKFNSKANEAENYRRQYEDQSGKATSLGEKVKELEQKVASLEADKTQLSDRINSLEGNLTTKEADKKALESKVNELQALNDELSKSKKKLAEAKEALEKKSQEYETLATGLKKEIQEGKIELSELKGKMTVKMKDKILFASGSIKIGKEGLDALAKVAGALKGVRGKLIRVEGHTDDVPTDPKGPFASNWELSVARSLAVVKFLQEKGVDPTLLTAAGYGQYQPLVANSSPENKSKNRRIEIVLAPGEVSTATAKK